MENSTKIVVLPGDLSGSEVVENATKVLDITNQLFDLNIETITFPCGGKYFLETGKEWPDEAFPTCQQSDAIFFGAIGYPNAVLKDGNIAGSSVILGLRFKLDLFANIRPTKLYPGVQHKVSDNFKTVWNSSDVDFTIIRENTEGLYNPNKKFSLPDSTDEFGIDLRTISKTGSERVIKLAYNYIEKYSNNKYHKLTCITKKNLLNGCKLFYKTFLEISESYSHIKSNHMLIDAFCHSIIREPEIYDVCVTSNLFGDIATDLASTLQGGMGMAPSAQVNGWSPSSKGLFEPIHGSAPQFANQNIVNPIGAILSLKLCFEWLSVKKNNGKFLKAAIAIETAIKNVLLKTKIRTFDLGGNSSTSQMTEAIIQQIETFEE